MSLLGALFGSNKKKEQKAHLAEMERRIEEKRKENERIDREVNTEIAALRAADDDYKNGGDIDKVISVYEKYVLDFDRPQWNIFNYCLNLAGYYSKANRNDTAWGYYNKMVLYATKHPEKNWSLYKIRFEQFKLLKSEKRHKDAFCMLVTSCVVRSESLPQPYFSKNPFIKDVKSTAKALGFTDADIAAFADQLEAKIMSRSLRERGVSKFCSDYFADHGI